MKILMLTTQLGYGGAETSFIRLANLLSETMEVTVALFTNTGTYSIGHEALRPPVILLDVPNASRIQRWLRRIRMLRNLKRTHDVTISFLSGPNLVNVLAGNNHRTIVSLRGSRHYDPVAPWLQRRVFQYILDPIVYRLARIIVPVSEGLRNEIPAYAQHKVVVIPPFVDTVSINKRLAEPIHLAFSTLRKQPVIVAAGRLSVEKGFHHLIRVFAALTRKHTAKLLLIGDGPMMAELRSQCSAFQLAVDDMNAGTSAVIFAGYQKNILPLLTLGRVYALTSTTEGFPNVLLEAMAANLPVLAADTPWGARTILYQHPPLTTDPHPTHSPTTADYGTLMPKIDTPEHQDTWVNAFQHALTNALPTYPERIHDFSLATIGERWKSLLQSMRAQ